MRIVFKDNCASHVLPSCDNIYTIASVFWKSSSPSLLAQQDFSKVLVLCCGSQMEAICQLNLVWNTNQLFNGFFFRCKLETMGFSIAATSAQSSSWSINISNIPSLLRIVPVIRSKNWNNFVHLPLFHDIHLSIPCSSRHDLYSH